MKGAIGEDKDGYQSRYARPLARCGQGGAPRRRSGASQALHGNREALSMNSFQHHHLRNADVKIVRDGDRISVQIDTALMERIVVEIERGTLSVIESADRAMARKTGVQRVEFEA
jgi:hypothetical protein